ncbi:IucA/IucC family C-terminal-domain containing protein [Methylobrevis pamukkalensis]|uniref:Ferric iron reductase FhuF-like transporter n=1 Tax=Methylobrevis pamukkalensis TaxID=1439726 RepID=A0A1E3H9J6_9HYPH|nr:IucA/IucC family C-terminal-domain containing protein [Methylobrevis pamukkalensis]ODN72161.1 Ferric iron reductase FhuF-like transporter [Methylobrevis pamukkalensis]
MPDLSLGAVGLRFHRHEVERDGRVFAERRADLRFLEPRSGQGLAEPFDGADTGSRRAHRLTRFRQTLEDHMAPVIARLHARTGLARSALWRLVGDAFAARFLEAGRHFGRLDAAKADALAVLKHPGSPLANGQLHFFDITIHDDAEPDRVLAASTFRSRGGCCRFYLTEGGALCTTCVLQDPATRDATIRAAMRRRLGLPQGASAA